MDSNIAHIVQKKARELDRQMRDRIMNKVKGDFFCDSCLMMHAPAKAAHLLYDTRGEYKNCISDWSRWVVAMDHVGCNEPMYYRDASILIPQDELYALFRETFEPLGLPVRRPEADVHRETGVEDYTRTFNRSGRTITLHAAGDRFFLRPRSNRQKSMWKNAEISIQYHFQHTYTTGLGCRIDPGEARIGGQQLCIEEGGWRAVAGKLTFYVGKLMYTQEYPALARLVATDASTGAHTFELDDNVEVFVPAATDVVWRKCDQSDQTTQPNTSADLHQREISNKLRSIWAKLTSMFNRRPVFNKLPASKIDFATISRSEYTLEHGRISICKTGPSRKSPSYR